MVRSNINQAHPGPEDKKDNPMSANLTRTVVAGALGAFLATAGSAFATTTSINDLDAVLNSWPAARQEVARKTEPTPTSQAGNGLQMVSVQDATAGKATGYRCKTVSGIRSWSRAKRSLARRGYRKLHVLRFTPRRIKPIAGLKGYARCAGGWYVVTASRGHFRYRLAVDARTFRVAAQTRIGVDRRRVTRKQTRPVHRTAPRHVRSRHGIGRRTPRRHY